VIPKSFTTKKPKNQKPKTFHNQKTKKPSAAVAGRSLLTKTLCEIKKKQSWILLMPARWRLCKKAGDYVKKLAIIDYVKKLAIM
jgi:hypothetical protein